VVPDPNEAVWVGKSTEEFIYQFLAYCGSLLVWDRVGLHPFGEVIPYHQNIGIP